MKLFSAFLKLVRWPNLIFILLTQWLFAYAVADKLIIADGISWWQDVGLWIVSSSSVLIAAAGYIINDYFDLNIDRINKPGKLVVDKVIRRRWAMLWHIGLSAIGILLALYYSWIYRSLWLLISNFLCVFLLFGYSIKLKKTLLSGNILISLLTAWVVAVLFFHYMVERNPTPGENTNSFVRISMLYIGFSFIISLIREVVKDAEDMKGDSKYGCKTMPLVWGLQVSRVFVAVLIVFLVSVLLILQLYVVRFNWWVSVAYCIVAIVAPLIYVLVNLFKAVNQQDFNRLSNWIKGIMFTGILSMIFFRFYL